MLLNFVFIVNVAIHKRELIAVFFVVHFPEQGTAEPVGAGGGGGSGSGGGSAGGGGGGGAPTVNNFGQ